MNPTRPDGRVQIRIGGQREPGPDLGSVVNAVLIQCP